MTLYFRCLTEACRKLTKFVQGHRICFDVLVVTRKGNRPNLNEIKWKDVWHGPCIVLPTEKETTMKKILSILILIGSALPGTVFAEPVDDLRILIQTGDFADQGSNAGFIFNLCPRRIVVESNYVNQDWDTIGVEHDCLVLKCDDSGLLNYNGGDYEEIDLFGNLEAMGCRVDRRGKSLSELNYPEDFSFFGFYPDRDYFEWSEDFWQGDDPGYDGWFLAGVELDVNGETVYRNPVVNRWIDIPHIGLDMTFSSNALPAEGGDLYSPHSLERDVAIAFYVETANRRHAGTSDLVSVRMPYAFRDDPNRRNGPLLQNSLDADTIQWMNGYGVNADGPLMTSPGGNSIDIELDWGGYNDHERRGAASYGVTIPYGTGEYDVVDKRFQVRIDGSESWAPRRIKAYYFKPGDPAFLEGQECWFQEIPFNSFWLSTNSSEGYPSTPLPGYYHSMRRSTCASLDTIEWGHGEDGAFAFGRR